MTDGQTQQLKSAFLESFSLAGNISLSCKIVGIHRNTIYAWLKSDSEFAKDFEIAELASTESLEAEAYRRAVNGVSHTIPVYSRGEYVTDIVETKYSDNLLMFLLKGRMPRKYRDNVSAEITGLNGGPLEIDDVTGLDDDSRLKRLNGLVARLNSGLIITELENAEEDETN